MLKNPFARGASHTLSPAPSVASRGDNGPSGSDDEVELVGCVVGGFTNEYGRPIIGSFDPGGAGSAIRANCPATNVTCGASTCSENRLSLH